MSRFQKIYHTLAQGTMIAVGSLQGSEGDVSDLVKYIYFLIGITRLVDLAMSVCPFLRKLVYLF